MPAKTRFSIAKSDIVKALNDQSKRILTKSDISTILESNREFWRLAAKTTVNRFIGQLLKDTPLKEISLDFPSKSYVRYLWGDASIYEIVQTINNVGHFSHYTAAFLHGLTTQVPKTICFRLELTHNPRNPSTIDQDPIDRAFSRKQRISNNFAIYKDQKIFVLYGKNTLNLGVSEEDSNFGQRIRVTDIERTLIDVAVRPGYSGGISQVLEIYRTAQPRVSINKLVSYLKNLDFAYPYHQAIGFYLERSGTYTESQMSLLDKAEKTVDFYLDYGIKQKEYSHRWRLFFPKGF